MVLPCPTVRRVMPGQISISGFSRFMFGVSCRKLGQANFCSLVWHLPRVTRHWQNARDENIYLTDHNCVRDTARDFLICAKPRLSARGCIEPAECGPTGGSCRPTESVGDDETDERDVEAQ